MYDICSQSLPHFGALAELSSDVVLYTNHMHINKGHNNKVVSGMVLIFSSCGRYQAHVNAGYKIEGGLFLIMMLFQQIDTISIWLQSQLR